LQLLAITIGLSRHKSLTLVVLQQPSETPDPGPISPFSPPISRGVRDSCATGLPPSRHYVAQPRMESSPERLEKIPGRFPVLLPEIETMRIRAPGMTVQLDAVATPLPRQLHRVRFQPRADALAANSLSHTQVADAAEIPRQRQLGDEMQQNDTHHPL